MAMTCFRMAGLGMPCSEGSPTRVLTHRGNLSRSQEVTHNPLQGMGEEGGLQRTDNGITQCVGAECHRFQDVMLVTLRV
ncbi:hypothetical protein SKAU_G00352050 [Synaphobranchus kaupii]|uniref:Uncharacterized protein n=1 Tax=Synaphobranchus kaupii TaxID=118154 RepID=A0A9Q1EKP3_SYNKA|nr:hypothetical protein SKAU_G00352050 [Synaphobranchus kaupii]